MARLPAKALPLVAQISMFLDGAPTGFDEFEKLTSAEKAAWRRAREIARREGKDKALLYLFRHGTIDRNQAIIAGVSKTAAAAMKGVAEMGGVARANARFHQEVLAPVRAPGGSRRELARVLAEGRWNVLRLVAFHDGTVMGIKEWSRHDTFRADGQFKAAVLATLDSYEAAGWNVQAQRMLQRVRGKGKRKLGRRNSGRISVALVDKHGVPVPVAGQAVDPFGSQRRGARTAASVEVAAQPIGSILTAPTAAGVDFFVLVALAPARAVRVNRGARAALLRRMEAVRATVEGSTQRRLAEAELRAEQERVSAFVLAAPLPADAAAATVAAARQRAAAALEPGEDRYAPYVPSLKGKRLKPKKRGRTFHDLPSASFSTSASRSAPREEVVVARQLPAPTLEAPQPTNLGVPRPTYRGTEGQVHGTVKVPVGEAKIPFEVMGPEGPETRIMRRPIITEVPGWVWSDLADAWLPYRLSAKEADGYERFVRAQQERAASSEKRAAKAEGREVRALPPATTLPVGEDFIGPKMGARRRRFKGGPAISDAQIERVQRRRAEAQRAERERLRAVEAGEVAPSPTIPKMPPALRREVLERLAFFRTYAPELVPPGGEDDIVSDEVLWQVYRSDEAAIAALRARVEELDRAERRSASKKRGAAISTLGEVAEASHASRRKSKKNPRTRRRGR